MGICQSKPIDVGHRHSFSHGGDLLISAPVASAPELIVQTSKGLPPPLPERADSPASSSSSLSVSEADSARPELKNPQQQLIERVERLLTVGCARYDDGDNDNEGIDTRSLTEALSAGNVALLEKTEQGKAVLLRASITLHVRCSVAKRDWKALAEQLAKAYQLDVRSAEIAAARETLARQQRVEEACAELRQALASKDVARLSAAVAAVEQLRVRGEESLLQPARSRLAEWKLALQLVREARDAKDYHLLVAALNTCHSSDFDCGDEVAAAAVLLAEVVAVRERALLGLHYVDRALLEDADGAAARLHYEDDERVTRARQLLALRPEHFLRSQYQAAVAQKDRARADSLSLQMKENFFRAHIDSFDWRQFPGLRSLRDFAAAGSMFSNRKKHNRTMLQWTDAAIPTSLTRLDGKSLVRAATKTFNKLLLLVNDAAVKPAARQQLQQDVVDLGVQEPRLRDELLLQIIKLLNGAPADARRRARAALCLALQCFAPSREFDPYLESFLRRLEDDNTNNSKQLLSMMHDTQFGYHAAVADGKRAPPVAQLSTEHSYRARIAPDAPVRVDEAFYRSVVESRPDFAWLNDAAARQRIAAILSYALPGQSATSVRQTNTERRPTTTTTTTTASSSSSHPGQSSTSSDVGQQHADVVDVEELLRQWDELAAEVEQKKQQQQQSDSSSSESDDIDSELESDEGFERYRAKALYAYQPDGEGKIGLQPDQTLVVCGEQPGGWLLGKNEATGERGYFPKAFVQSI